MTTANPKPPRSGIGCNALLELMPLYRGTTCELKR